MIAVLYDIHGNLPALEAVLADAQKAGASEYLLGGDYSAFGAWPREAVELLEALAQPALWLRGNWERWQGRLEGAPQDEIIQGAGVYANEAIGWDRVQELHTLPVSAERAARMFCHGSPLSDVESFAPPEYAAQPPAATADEDTRLLDGTTASDVFFGHTHIQFSRTTPGAVKLTNPGSVGLPLDGDTRAAYALIAEDGRTELRRVDYDHPAAASALQKIGEPWADLTARRLLAASFLPPDHQ